MSVCLVSLSLRMVWCYSDTLGADSVENSKMSEAVADCEAVSECWPLAKLANTLDCTGYLFCHHSRSFDRLPVCFQAPTTRPQDHKRSKRRTSKRMYVVVMKRCSFLLPVSVSIILLILLTVHSLI